MVVPLSRSVSFSLAVVVLTGLAGCTPNYSPNTYAAGAVQQANKVETAIVVGFRQVEISANGTVGAVTGGAAGGVLGSQSGSFGINSALGAVGGTAIGSLIGTSIEHMTGDTKGWEYIVRKPDGELLSVTQKEEKPIPLGQKVLVITGSQARIVADYSALPDPPAPAPAPKDKAADEKAKGEDTAKAVDAVKAEEKPKADTGVEVRELPPPTEPTAKPAEAPAEPPGPAAMAPIPIYPPAPPVEPAKPSP